MQDETAIRRATRLDHTEIYEIIRREGDEELSRPTQSLLWSGVAAGLVMSFSVLGEAILRNALPDTSWRYLIENLGYSFGFLMVILGRMQLFTENTITTIFPLVARGTLACFGAVIRLWSIVLAANVLGAAIAAGFMVTSGAFAPELVDSINELSRHATGFAPGEAFLRGVPAGILVAAIVWMLPGQEGSDVLLIVLFTWLIAAGDFTHIIAGSVEMWVLAFQGTLSMNEALLAFFLPVLAGNVVGGTVVFTLLAWGQVKHEVSPAGETEH
ncbi:MAG: formate/nitrite transporter family protein [Pseudomonadota bacterium]